MPRVDGFRETWRMVHKTSAETLSLGNTEYQLTFDCEENSDPGDDENGYTYIQLRYEAHPSVRPASFNEFRARIPLACVDQFVELFTRAAANARANGTLPPRNAAAAKRGRRA